MWGDPGKSAFTYKCIIFTMYLQKNSFHSAGEWNMRPYSCSQTRLHTQHGLIPERSYSRSGGSSCKQTRRLKLHGSLISQVGHSDTCQVLRALWWPQGAPSQYNPFIIYRIKTNLTFFIQTLRKRVHSSHTYTFLKRHFANPRLEARRL